MSAEPIFEIEPEDELLDAGAPDWQENEDVLADVEAFLKDQPPDEITLAPDLDEPPFSLSVDEFIQRDRQHAEPLLADRDGRAIVAQHGLVLCGGLGGSGKTTLFIELGLHLAAGVDYLCFTVPRPVSVLLIENEGPEDMFAEKLEAKLATFPHELKARLAICTAEWGSFDLRDSNLRERLRADLAAHQYDLIFGDPLDSLGMEGVGTPDDTRKFMALMKETGLHRSVAWWLNTHPRKEETKEALNEISGAWGGKPDAVLLLRQLSDDRSQIRFPKLRWAKRGRRPAILLDFDADTETFTYLGEEGEEERDYIAEMVALMSDGRPRTAKEIGAKQEADPPGIGAADTTLKGLLETHPDLFVSFTGDDAKRIGRHPTATVWLLAEKVQTGSIAPVAPLQLGDEGVVGATCDALKERSSSCSHLTPDADLRPEAIAPPVDEELFG